MKSAEYYEKYITGLTAVYTLNDQITDEMKNGTFDRSTAYDRRMQAIHDVDEAGQAMLKEMLGELSAIRHERNAKTTKSMKAIIKEMDDRWNKVVRMIREEFGACPVKEHGVIIASIALEPRIAELFPNIKLEESDNE